MDYIAPLNTTPTEDNPWPAYFDGNPQTGQEGSYPPGVAIEYPQREMLAVIQAAGLIPTNGDLTQLLQAINSLIATAVAAGGGGGGGGGAADWSQNPVYPNVTVNGGVMTVTASTGSVAIPDGQTFVHRGGNAFNSTDTDSAARTFTTAAGKTYHLRWRYNGGSPAFGLYDVADAGYNPTSAAETNAAFDTTYDDMLIARVVTDGANVPTVTALKNLHRLASTGELQGPKGAHTGSNNFMENNTAPSAIQNYSTVALNWARMPEVYLRALNDVYPQGGSNGKEFSAGALPLSRYQVAVWGQGDEDIWVNWGMRA
jgi:hypothetical protein